MAKEMLNYQLCIVFVLAVFQTVQGKPSSTWIQLDAIQDRIDGSQDTNDQDTISVTTDESIVDPTTAGTVTTTHDRVLFTDTPIMDVVTIIWYLATFIALVSFFLVMACADRNRCRSRKPVDNEQTPPPTPAPSYRQFAPPSYDTLMFDKDNDSIFIIPYDARIDSEHQQYAESLAANLEHVIVQQIPPSNDMLGTTTTSDIRSDDVVDGDDDDADRDASDVPPAPGTEVSGSAPVQAT